MLRITSILVTMFMVACSGSWVHGQTEATAKQLLNQISTLEKQGNLTDAIETAKTAIATVNTIPFRQPYQKIEWSQAYHLKLGNLYRQQLEFSLADKAFRVALQQLEQAKAIRQQTQAPGDFQNYVRRLYVNDKVTMQLSQMKLYETLGQFDIAKKLVTEATAPLRASSQEPNIVEAICLNNQGWLALHQPDGKQLQTALQLFARSLNLIQTSTSRAKYPHVEAETHTHLGDAYLTLQQPAKARDHYQQAKLFFERSYIGKEGFQTHPRHGLLLYNLARVQLLENGNAQEIQNLLDRSLAIYEKAKGRDDPDPSIVRYLRAYHYHRTGQPALAIAEYARARQVWHKYAQGILSCGSIFEHEHYLDNKDRQWLHGALTLGYLHRNNQAAVNASAEWLLNGKSLSFQLVQERSRFRLAKQSPEANQLLQALQATREQLLDIAIQPAPTDNAKRAEREQQSNRLTQKETELARQLSQALNLPAINTGWTTLEQVQQAIPKNAVLVELVRLEEKDYRQNPQIQRTPSVPGLHWQSLGARYVAWVIPPKGNTRIIDLGSADDLEARIRAFQTELLKALPKMDAKGNVIGKTIIATQGEAVAETLLMKPLDRLSESILGPLHEAIEGAEHWIICPDAELWNVPWAALRTKLKSNKLGYAVEDHVVSYLSTGRELAQTSANTSQKTPNYIYAGMEYPEYVANLSESWIEGASITKLLRDATGNEESVQFVSGSDATLPHFQQTIQSLSKKQTSPPIIVLSTHAFFEDAEADKILPDNPLLRCGILFSSTGRKNLILTGQTVLDHYSFPTTDLVVLSACETGIGKVRMGEGPLALSTVFRMAGAKSVIGTLWEASDKETTNITTQLFLGMTGDRFDSARSLAEAQRAWIEAHRISPAFRSAHPIYWAALVHTGPTVRLRAQP